MILPELESAALIELIPNPCDSREKLIKVLTPRNAVGDGAVQQRIQTGIDWLRGREQHSGRFADFLQAVKGLDVVSLMIERRLIWIIQPPNPILLKSVGALVCLVE
jgi:hypothetical protein